MVSLNIVSGIKFSTSSYCFTEDFVCIPCKVLCYLVLYGFVFASFRLWAAKVFCFLGQPNLPSIFPLSTLSNAIQRLETLNGLQSHSKFWGFWTMETSSKQYKSIETFNQHFRAKPTVTSYTNQEGSVMPKKSLYMLLHLFCFYSPILILLFSKLVLHVKRFPSFVISHFYKN